MDFFSPITLIGFQMKKGILKRGNEKAKTSATWQPKEALKRGGLNSGMRRNKSMVPGSCSGYAVESRSPRKETVGRSMIEPPDAANAELIRQSN